jgi:toxin-antitoxin system PIN domain toxin
MIAVDTNLLVYAHREDSPHHRMAFDAIIHLANRRSGNWTIPWPSLHEFLAVVTHPKIYDPPSPIDVAFASIDQWLNCANCRLIGESEFHLDQLKSLCHPGKIKGPKIHDARIAAICLQNDVDELWTADRDFSLFETLKTKNPLVRDEWS